MPFNSTTFTNFLFSDSESSQSYSVPHHVLEAWWSLLQPEEYHRCDWGDDQDSDKIRQQTHCCPLQWYSDSQWNVLCHCNHHWEVQDRGSRGYVPGRQGSASMETRGCSHCGEWTHNSIIIDLVLILNHLVKYFTLFPSDTGKLQAHFWHNFGVSGIFWYLRQLQEHLSTTYTFHNRLAIICCVK